MAQPRSRASSRLVALAISLAAPLTSACGGLSAPASTPDSGTVPIAPHPDATTGRSSTLPDAQTGCVDLAAGGPCSPIGTACPVPGCLTWFCASGMWVAEPQCDASGYVVDARADELDGSVSVPSCAACPADALCVVTVRTEGGCLVRDGSVCDDAFVSYACQNLPAACAGAATCGCAGTICGAGHAVCSDDAGVDAGEYGPVLELLCTGGPLSSCSAPRFSSVLAAA